MFLIHYNLFREKMAFERRKISYGMRQSRGIRIVSTSYAKTKRYRFLDKSECYEDQPPRRAEELGAVMKRPRDAQRKRIQDLR